MIQPSLFDDAPAAAAKRVKSPLCVYETHCGHRATFGESEDRGTTIHREIYCEHCGNRGHESEAKQG